MRAVAGADIRIVANGSLILDLSRCRECFECEEICPTGVLVVSSICGIPEGGYSAEIPDTCIMCRYCLTCCPDKALHINSQGERRLF